MRISTDVKHLRAYIVFTMRTNSVGMIPVSQREGNVPPRTISNFDLNATSP